MRGDVKEAELVFPRYVNIGALEKGKVGFEDKTVQQHDTQSFDSDKMPGKALAIGRCVVDFTPEYKETPTADLSSDINGNLFVSSTKQLQWQQGDSSTEVYFRMNTPASKAVVGFAKGKSFKLGEVDIDFNSRYGTLYITATEPSADIASSKKLLVIAIARCPAPV